MIAHSHAPLLPAQIKILKILALLGVADKAASENMYSVLADVLRKSDTGATIGNAILYEGIATIAAIYPNPKLLQQSAQVTSRFLKVISTLSAFPWSVEETQKRHLATWFESNSRCGFRSLLLELAKQRAVH